MFGYCQPGFLTAAAKTHADQRGVDRRQRRHRLQRRLRLRARRSDHQGQALVLRRLRAGVLADRLHALHEAPDRLPQGRLPNGTLSTCDPVNADDASRTSIRRPASTSPTSSTREIRSSTRTAYNALGKINYAVDAEHQGQLSVQAQPSARRAARASSARRSTATTSTALTTDVSGSGRRSSTTTRPRSRRSSAGTATRTTATRSTRRSTNAAAARSSIDGNLGAWGPGFGERVGARTARLLRRRDRRHRRSVPAASRTAR